jgi:DNA-binding NarL/FixJ family response regulator
MPVTQRIVPLRVLLVGTQCLTCTSLAALFAPYEQLQILGPAYTPSEIRAATQATSPDLLLVDLDGRDGPDLTLLLALRQHLPQTPLITLSTHVVGVPLTQLLTSGAQAHLTKEISPAELLAVIDTVRQGGGQQFVMTTLLKPLLTSPPVTAGQQGQEKLTPREQEVVALLLQGLCQKEIAQVMQIKHQSVRNYADRIYQKFGVRSQTELLLCLMRSQSSNPPPP